MLNNGDFESTVSARVDHSIFTCLVNNNSRSEITSRLGLLLAFVLEGRLVSNRQLGQQDENGFP